MLGVQQVGAVLRKNVTEKKRSLRVSCCECCSHLLILILLMYGYALSEVLYFDAETYATIDISIPPVINSNGGSQATGSLDILNGPLPIPSFDTYISVSRIINASGSEDSTVVDLISSTNFGRRFGNLLNIGAIHFAPEGPESDSLIEFLNRTTTTFSSMTYHVHKSENEAIKYIQDNLDEYAFALIVLPDPGTISSSNIQYKIRQNYTTLPNTNQVVNWISIGLDTEYQMYLLSGFLTLQKTVDTWALEYTGSNANSEDQCHHPQYWTMPFPTAAFDQNIFFQAVGFLLGLAMIMATMYPVSKLIKAVVEEKESKMREVMKIMGLKNWAHQMSWFITALVLFLWIALSTTFLCHVSFLPSTDPQLLFLFIFTFCLSEITFSFLISSFFSKAKLAAIVGPVCLFCAILPRYIFFGTNRYEEQQSKYFASLLSPSAFAFGADILADYEYSGVGVQRYNMENGLYNFWGCIQIMFFDFLWYGVLAWYLDQVVPGDVGTPLHPLFFLHASYWFPICAKSSNETPPVEREEVSNILRKHQQHPDYPPEGHVESIDDNELQNVKVLISGLRKTYTGGKFGVKHLSVAMLKDQITCLLGHNGAGKTTTISVLTGLVRATAGDVSIWGHSLSSSLDSIRQITGICPQQNVLFSHLTVEEHLYFFSRIKGVPEREIPSMVGECLRDVGLEEKRSVQVHALSGGMKRKTCLAVALAGNPLCVFLDEPTSGMDPYSRRSTWELLQKKKKGRVIILTTHFLEEAEILGDRVIILSEGRLLCAGSSLFLKSKFGAGYMLTITLENISSREANNSGIEENKLVDLVSSFVPGAKLYSSIGAEVVMEIPLHSSAHFPALFQALKGLTVLPQSDRVVDDVSFPLLIASYGIQYVTLEQVFIRLSHQEHSRSEIEKRIETSNHEVKHEKNDVQYDMLQVKEVQEVEMSRLGDDDYEEELGECSDRKCNVSQVLPSDKSGYTNVTAELVFSQFLVVIQIVELFRKRLIIASRDKNGLFFQIIVPALQIALVLAVLTIDVNPAGKSLKMHADIYEDKVTALLSTNDTIDSTEDIRDELNGERMYLSNTNATDSMELSQYMLSTYSNPAGERFGGYVYNDTIGVNVTVDWAWVRSNLPFIIDNLGSFSIIGRNIDMDNILNFTQLSDLNITSNSPAAESALDLVFGNESQILIGNVTLYRSNVTDLIDGTDFSLNSISYESIIANDGDLVLVGVEISLQNNTLAIGNITLVPNDIADFLPNATVSYYSSLFTNYSVLQNSTSPHAVGVFIGELVSAALLSCTGDPTATYLLRNHPLPLTIEEAIEIQVILSVLASLFILIPLCYIPASFVIFIVKERTSKSKHLQLVSGISPFLYWFATYMWDMAIYLALSGFIMLTFFFYGEEAAKIFIGSNEATWAVYSLLLLYGLSSIPISYLYSFLFDNHSTAQISIMTLNFFTGFVFVMAFYIMISIPSTRNTAEVLVYVFRLFPPYNIGEGLINISVNYFNIFVLERNASYFSWEVTGRNLTYMAGECVVYLTTVLLSEASSLRNLYFLVLRKYLSLFPLPSSDCSEEEEEEDEDVTHERGIVQKGDPSDFILFLNGIEKTYSPAFPCCGTSKRAVRGINLACAAGERFGLLGINGAGKTTTLGVLTGDIQPSRGEAFITGLPLSNPHTREYIGFCPQIDPLLDLMTGWETLWLFGRVRGINASQLRKRCDDLIEKVGLSPHAHKPCGSYSGGNKRKLSLAVALVGNPTVLFLDEPSTGMDATAKRQMWDLINSVSANRTVVLTTHSMEECEAICTRIGIMVSGRLKCLGSSQHLKSKFGASYEINIQCPEEHRQSCVSSILKLGNGVVEEEHRSYVRLKMDYSIDLSLTFDTLEALKAENVIAEYSVSQSTLEQIFIKFAKSQDPNMLNAHLATTSYKRNQMN